MTTHFTDSYFQEQIQQLQNCIHGNPHMILGLHSFLMKKK